MKVYLQEKDLIQELIKECQDKSLTEVIHRRLDRAQERMLELGRGRTGRKTARSEYWMAEKESQILNDLAQQWLKWMKTGKTSGTTEPDENVEEGL